MDWTFEGCDGTCAVEADTGWVTLDRQSSQFPDAGRFQTRSYSVVNRTAFRQYRLRFTANHGAGIFQLSEIQLF